MVTDPRLSVCAVVNTCQQQTGATVRSTPQLRIRSLDDSIAPKPNLSIAHWNTWSSGSARFPSRSASVWPSRYSINEVVDAVPGYRRRECDRCVDEDEWQPPAPCYGPASEGAAVNVSIQSDDPPPPRLYARYCPFEAIVGSSMNRPESGKRVTGRSGPPFADNR